MDDPTPSRGRCRREETILCRLHIGYTFLTHFYLLKGEEPPACIPCDQLCSIEHLLTGCVDLTEWRRQFFKTESLSVLFSEYSPDSIIQFLKCMKLFNKLWWHYCAPWFYYCDSHTFFFFLLCHFNCIKNHILLTRQVLFCNNEWAMKCVLPWDNRTGWLGVKH